VPSVIEFLCDIFVTVCIFVINFVGGKYHMSVGENRVGKTRKKERKKGIRVADESIMGTLKDTIRRERERESEILKRKSSEVKARFHACK